VTHRHLGTLLAPRSNYALREAEKHRLVERKKAFAAQAIIIRIISLTPKMLITRFRL